ncbi:MAG: 30S ribosomal protein S8 [Chlamydiia bacterium]|nr:30S ribosomal protein S8 [Chlamydiia bacterium]
MQDTIADMLTRIRNALMAKHRYVDIQKSKMNRELARVLEDKGFIAKTLVDDKKYYFRLFLKYDNRMPIIHGLKRISKPSRRVYVKSDKIPRVLDGLGVAIVSTPKGVLDGETARKEGCGGELLCSVW